MDAPQELDAQARQRYARQLILPEVGEAGQLRLARARVLIVGLGGLGAPAALYLAAAGVGRLGLVEFDTVDPSNLHRQVLYTAADTGTAKLDAAAARLTALVPGLQLDRYPDPVNSGNARQIVQDYDLVLDGTDNFAARYAINDACVAAGVTNVHGAVQGFEGQVTVLAHGDGPCYRCLFPDEPPADLVPSCAEAGVLGVLPGTIALLQATETLKLLLGIGEPLAGRILRFDALAARFTEVRIERDPACPVCSETVRQREAAPAEARGQARPEPQDLPFTIEVGELARRQAEGTAPLVLDVRLDAELALAKIPLTALHIPLHLLPVRTGELQADREYAVLCHHGTRSMQAVHFLRSSGFAGARNVKGGIDLWSHQIDTSVPRY